MSTKTTLKAIARSKRSDRFHLWRARKDNTARWLIAIGGVSVIFAVVLIFFYLLWVVFPLFLPASIESREALQLESEDPGRALMLSMEEQMEVLTRVNARGEIQFINLSDGSLIEQEQLPGTSPLLDATEALEFNGEFAVLSESGGLYLLKHEYETRFDGGVESRRIIPSLVSPYGKSAVANWPGGHPVGFSFSSGDSGMLVAAAWADGNLRVYRATRTENFLTGKVTLDAGDQTGRLAYVPAEVAVSGNQRWIFVGDGTGRVHQLDSRSLQSVHSVTVSNSEITRIQPLLGGFSILVGTADGMVHQLFPVRDPQGEFRLQHIRSFGGGDSAVLDIVSESRRKGFAVTYESGDIAFFHSTAEREVLRWNPEGIKTLQIALAPRANGIVVDGGSNELSLFRIENEHPEVSVHSIWRKVWYENYDQPEYVWQSSAATNEFEPKFSLTPLVFGTLKAALYAMLFAIPLALMGAAYTAYFMAPGLRQWVKPGIEIMAALPTVILGFLAGLWFAPFLEEHLAGIFMILLVLPPGLLLFAWAWHRYGSRYSHWVSEGWEPLLLIPVLLVLGYLAMAFAEPVQSLFFGGDLRTWLSEEAGISYDQRNALVVGCAMGFAVVPTIFSIAEDAIFGVPESLSNGSLALGSTPWQTLVRIVLPTASPGIFSGLMIGLGRAVGETMIVLMATGNTPVMDWSLFEGMRTLAANIAVEMPESEVNSTHYRVLFLAALVLFMFTFIVNTGAEIIRQRLRDKYSSL